MISMTTRTMTKTAINRVVSVVMGLGKGADLMEMRMDWQDWT
jgi:hypothetical protein